MGDSLSIGFEASSTVGGLGVPRCSRKSKTSRVALPALPSQMLSYIGIAMVAVIAVVVVWDGRGGGRRFEALSGESVDEAGEGDFRLQGSSPLL